ncbi:glycine zipper 2TM domain-containing protein [Ignatzschineria indica]|nr:glycine zipper 2TM domain-containing protein [Ignatzschineria indica]
MKLMTKVASLLAIATVVTACSTWDGMSSKEKGMVIGTGAGAVAGAAVTDTILGTGIGAAVGGVIGNEVGKAL